MKSIGNGMTMPRDLVNDMEVKMAFYMLSETVATRLRENHFAGNIIEIYVRDNDLMGFTRHHKIPVPTNISDEIARNAMALFLANYRWHKPIRGVGVRVAGLKGENYPYQLDLFNSEERREKQLAADRAVDQGGRRDKEKVRNGGCAAGAYVFRSRYHAEKEAGADNPSAFVPGEGKSDDGVMSEKAPMFGDDIERSKSGCRFKRRPLLGSNHEISLLFRCLMPGFCDPHYVNRQHFCFVLK